MAVWRPSRRGGRHAPAMDGRKLPGNAARLDGRGKAVPDGGHARLRGGISPRIAAKHARDDGLVLVRVPYRRAGRQLRVRGAGRSIGRRGTALCRERPLVPDQHLRPGLYDARLDEARRHVPDIRGPFPHEGRPARTPDGHRPPRAMERTALLHPARGKPAGQSIHRFFRRQSPGHRRETRLSARSGRYGALLKSRISGVFES